MAKARRKGLVALDGGHLELQPAVQLAFLSADTFTGQTLAARRAFFPAAVTSTELGNPTIATP